MKSIITIIGMMGAGKSYIGQELARHLGRCFYDSDRFIEDKEGKTITKIFAEDGEKYFREIEFCSIDKLLDKDNCVISTGGGALIRDETLQKIKDKSISIWIKSDIDRIWSRIKDDDARPLLQCDNPQEKLSHLLKSRENLYNQADIHVDNSSDNVQETVQKIMQELYKYEKN